MMSIMNEIEEVTQYLMENTLDLHTPDLVLKRPQDLSPALIIPSYVH